MAVDVCTYSGRKSRPTSPLAGVVDHAVGMVGAVVIGATTQMALVTLNYRSKRSVGMGKVLAGKLELACGGGAAVAGSTTAELAGLTPALGAGQVAELAVNVARLDLGITVAIDVLTGIVHRPGYTRSVVVNGVAGGATGNAAEGDVDFSVDVLGCVENGCVVGNCCCVTKGAAIAVLANHVFLVTAGGHIVQKTGGAVAAVAAVAVDGSAAPGRSSFNGEGPAEGGAVAVAVKIGTVRTAIACYFAVVAELHIQ